ncbi:MAG: hypothetical protein V4572_07460 [Bacteroidota bacterium]
MKAFLYFIFSLFLANCKSYETIEKENESDLPNHAKAKLLKAYNAEDSQYSIIVFRDFFYGERITLKSDGKILLNDTIRTIKNNGYAKMIRINNENDVILYDAKLKERIKIESKLAKKYKYINVNKYFNEPNADGIIVIDKKPYKIQYTNTFAGFM